MQFYLKNIKRKCAVISTIIRYGQFSTMLQVQLILTFSVLYVVSFLVIFSCLLKSFLCRVLHLDQKPS